MLNEKDFSVALLLRNDGSNEGLLRKTRAKAELSPSFFSRTNQPSCHFEGVPIFGLA